MHLENLTRWMPPAWAEVEPPVPGDSLVSLRAPHVLVAFRWQKSDVTN